MPTYRTVNSETMLKAAESGQEGIRRAADRAQQEQQSGREFQLRAQGQVNDEFQRQQQIDEQARSNRVREGLEAGGLAETQRRGRMQEAIAQDAQDIEMADRGLEAKGTSRADKLRSEMDRGASQTGGAGGAPQDPEEQASAARFQDQAGKPLEVAGPDARTVAPTELRKKQESSKLVTNRMNAQANYLNSVRNFQEAKLKGNDEALKAEEKSLQQPIKEAARMFDLGKKNNLSDSQWNDIKDLAGEVPDPAVQQEIAAKRMGPALGRFLQARISQSAIQYMAVTGNMPDGDLVDLASPAMRQFTQNAEQVQAYLRAADEMGGGVLTASLKIDSLAKRNQIVRKLTAQAMLEDRATPKPTGGSAIPSQGGQAMNKQGGQNGPARQQSRTNIENEPPVPGTGGPGRVPLPSRNPWSGEPTVSGPRGL